MNKNREKFIKKLLADGKLDETLQLFTVDDIKYLEILIEDFIEKKKINESIKLLDKILNLDSNNEYAIFNKAYCLYELEKYDETIKYYDKAIKINPKKDSAWINKGATLSKIEQYEKAIKCFNKAIKINPKNDVALINKGLSLNALGRYDEAINCYKKALKINPKNDATWINKGVSTDKLGKYEEAIKCFEKAIKINPKSYTAVFNKAVDLGILERYEEAIKCYDKAIKIDPKNDSAWINKGYDLDEVGRYEEAIKCYDKATKIDPKNHSAVYNKAIALENLKKHYEAIKCYDKAIKIDPKKAGAWGNKGLVFVELKRYDEAIKCFEEVIKIDPKDEYAWHNKAVTYDEIGKYDESITSIEKAIEINPKNEETWTKKGKVLGKIGEFDEALKSFGHAYLIHEGIQLGADYSLNLAKPLRSSELEIISHSLEKTKKDWVKISMVQLNFDLDLNVHPKHFGYTLKEEETIKIKILNALELAKRERVDIICFPELSTTEKLLNEVKQKYKDMIVIFGSFYKNGFNICPIIVDGTVYNYQKINPSPNFEIEILANRCMKKGKNVFLFETQCGKIIVFNCMDYLKETHQILTRLEKSGINVDLIIVPQYNKSIKLFQEHANHVCQSYKCPYILQINAQKVLGEKVNGTSLIGFEHNGALQTYKMNKIKPEDTIKFKFFEIIGEKMVTFELDIKNKGNILPALGPKIRCFKQISLEK